MMPVHTQILGPVEKDTDDAPAPLFTEDVSAEVAAATDSDDTSRTMPTA